MAKIRKLAKKSWDLKDDTKGLERVTDIGTVPSLPEKPTQSDKETIEIDKWLKLVESYWQKGTRRTA
ncbi:MAG TPA: hypothetical protein VJS37_07480 [Terriglobales bacterium]|nr:hypothetical protein [Terriglobales bacterium]